MSSITKLGAAAALSLLGGVLVAEDANWSHADGTNVGPVRAPSAPLSPTTVVGRSSTPRVELANPHACHAHRHDLSAGDRLPAF